MNNDQIKCQIPYNYIYGEEIISIIYSNKDYIDSIYFGFENACRATILNKYTVDEHINKLTKIKKETGIKMAYVLNTLLPASLNGIDKAILNTDLVDVVIAARDSVFEEVNILYKNKFEYELSRFYYLIPENVNRSLEQKASYVAFGFEKELCVCTSKDVKKIYIVNENCYEGCNMKLVHNINQLRRNMGERIEKFNCPFLDKRRFYDYYDIDLICKKYSIQILKVCDRAFPDNRLKEELHKWIRYVKQGSYLAR